MRTWSNHKGEGKLFSIELLDEQGGQIRATMFQEAAEKFFPIFQEGKVYTISRGSLKPRNVKFNKTPHDYELNLGRDAEVEFCGEDKKIKHQLFDFKPINAIQDMPVETYVDIIGVVQSIEPISEIISSRTKKEHKKRVIRLCDTSNAGIDLTLWNDKAVEFDENALPTGAILAAKGLRVGDFSGRSLSSGFTSAFQINPDLPEATKLHQWYQATQGQGVTSLSASGGGGRGPSRRITIGDIQELRQNLDETKAEYFDLKATLIFCRKYEFDRPPWYEACPSDSCNKKVMQVDEGQYRCEKCDKIYPGRSLRYILSMMVADEDGHQWVTAFNTEAEAILGKTAEQLNEYVMNGDEESFNKTLQEPNLKEFIFGCRAKIDMNNEEQQIRVNLTKATPMDPLQEAKTLLEKIAKYDDL
mmetsp:Transcript_2701/g.4146  ORF Transcript_2701/g.4146 Transcript_2701/m.4146 type:complete len:416 (+) Transcript_2701:184-1431(+)